MLDILVINGQVNKKITKQDLKEAQFKADEYANQKKIENECEFYSKEEIESEILLNEYTKLHYHVTNLYEFLYIIPLVDPIILSAVLRRISGSGISEKNYIFNQLEYLYNSISNEDAKKFVKYLEKYYNTYPVIGEIDDKTELTIKTKKN